MRRTNDKAPAVKAGGSQSAVLGFRVHSGWAAVVAVAGTARSPKIIDRRRIQLANPLISGSKQPYHAAEGLPIEAAEQLIGTCQQSTDQFARTSLREAIDDIGRQGYKLIGCGVLLSSAKPAPALASILASHTLIHSAEGDFFRNAVINAGDQFNLPITRIREKDLLKLAEERLGVTTENLLSLLLNLGKPLGPPWRQDEKYAALVAIMVMESAA